MGKARFNPPMDFRPAATTIISLIFFTGCFQAAPVGQKSVLVIVIPDFRADDLTCSNSSDSLTPRLDAICDESVRFTHAYTSSALAVPAMASILTGLYPVENGVHRNDSSVYEGEVTPLPQWAREKGLETLLVSGGVPVLRKTAVAKGFSDFDDSVRVNGSYYRSAMESVKKFLNLVESQSDGTPFFGVLSLADLEFPQITSDNQSETLRREGGYNGKIQDIDEAVGFLRSVFRLQKIWDPMTVVIVGAAGSDRVEHDGLSTGLNLYDEVVHVPLLIKPSRKPRDQGPSWKVDEPVNLVDLGVTLFHILGGTGNKQSLFPIRDFSEALEGKDLAPQKRPLFVESDLPSWRNWGPRLVMMRYGEWSFWAPPEERIYNTYTDHMETRNVFSLDFNAFNTLDGIWKPFAPNFSETNSNLPPGALKFVPISIGEKLRGSKTFFSEDSPVPEKISAFKDLEMRRPADWQILQWHVQLLVESKDWAGLHELLSHRSPLDSAQAAELKLWQTFLHLKYHIKLKPQEAAAPPPAVNCLYLAVSLKRFSLEELESFQTEKACPDRETQDWVDSFLYYKLKRMKDAVAYFDMARSQTEKREDQTTFAKYFWLDGATWDYLPALPAGPSVFELFTELLSNSELLDFIRKKQLP